MRSTARRELTDHYEGVYDDGWHALQERHARRLREQGLLNEAASLPSLATILVVTPAVVFAWTALRRHVS